jgi:Protein of unknown function (DUF3592)
MRWTDPSTWPFPIWIWLLFIVGGWAVSLWKWRKRRVEAEWPSAAGRIETARIDDSEKKILGLTITGTEKKFPAVLAYSYSVGGASYGGSFKRVFATIGEAADFIRDLEGKPLEVQYNPTKPQESALTDAALDTALQTRSPAPPAATQAAFESWMKPFLWVFIAFALVGFVLSLWFHIRAIMGHSAPDSVFVLHVGIFVVWFPAVLAAIKLQGGGRGKDLWKRVLRGDPDWVRYVTYGIFGYSWISMMANFGGGKHPQSGPDPDASTLRSFSCVWMAFYSMAAAILYSAVRQTSTTNRCVNGHAVSANSRFCEICGQPISHAPLQSPPQ